MLDGLRSWLISLIEIAFMGFDSSLAESADVLRNGFDETTWNNVLTLSGYLKPFCLIIVGFCLMIELAQVASRVDIIKWEHGLKICVKMVIAKVCIDVAPTFLRACNGQAQEWVGLMTDGGSNLGLEAKNRLVPLVQQVDGFAEILGLVLVTLIVMLAVKICGLIITVMAYGRMFEIYVYLAVSPFPFAFLPLGGDGGASISRITSKFIKSFIAVCLQGVMMIIVMRVFDMVMSSVIANTYAEIMSATDPATGAVADANAAITNLSFTMLLGSIALIMSVVKSGSWAKNVIDAM